MRARSLIVALLALPLLINAQVLPPRPAVSAPVTNYAAVPPPAPPATGRVAVDTTPGYARMLFTFGAPSPVAASIADGVLTLRLSQPINTNIDNFTGSLGPYVSTGRRDPDGLTYRFALKNPVALHNSTQGNQTAVDLVPDSFKGVPPDLPPPPPPTVKTALPDLTNLPVVKVRVAEFANYTRLMFDWPAQVNYTAYPGQGRISIRFETPAKPDFAMLEMRRPAWVKSAGWHLDGLVTVVEFETDGESTFRDFRQGPNVGIDVFAPKTDAGVFVAAGKPAAPANSSPAPKGSDAAAALQPAAPAPAVAAPAPAARGAIAESPNPRAELTRDGAALHFPGARGHAAAVFMRGETLWIVLDAHPALDAATLLAPVSTILAKAEADQSYGAAVLKLVFKAPLLAAVEEREAALTVRLTARAASSPDAVAFTRQGADGQTTLTATLPGATHVIPMVDNEAGDHLFVVPGRPGKGVLTPRRFVEMEALPTAAGIAIVPFTDDLFAEVASEIVTVSRPKGLALSSASGAVAVPAVQLPVAKQGPAFIDFTQWANGPDENVLKAERSFRAQVARLPESEGNAARLRLARYLLANQLAPEALGEIQLIQSSDTKLANDPSLAVMKGAAQYMMGRYADAKLSLSAGPLDAEPHAALWRGMAETRLGDFANARRDLAASLSVLRFYPEEWQARARLARAETGIAQGDLASTNDALDQLSPDLKPRESVEARLYEAQLLAAQGHVNEAIARLRTLERTDYAPIAARATFARVDTELTAKKATPADAIAALEQLRYRWRGDDIELRTLRKLGSLYFAQEKWREGLGVLRIAALNFPSTDLGREAQDDMRAAYADLFLAGKADTMRPVDALAMFYDFIELTPIGRDGDEMIRRLADRLVAIDLLGPAAQLLDHQVKERLDGVARAAVATKLALIYLLDQKPREALATINDTRQTRLPDELNQQRRILEARALLGLKQFEPAIDLIADDDTPEAKRVRADIYWDSNNWALAGAKTEDLLGDRWNVSGPLEAAERAQIMRAAVAYSLAGDEAALDLLRERYAAKMMASPDAKGFAIVTERLDRHGVAFRDLAKQIASVDSLQAFMDDFKKQGAAPAKTARN